MSSLASVMDSSLTAMFAAQIGLATTSHNIANSDRPGYSRQENLVAARAALLMPYGAIGTGVNVQGIRRARDEYLQMNLRTQTARLASYSATDSTLYEVENILGSVDNDHLGGALSNFFKAWSDLATPPFDDSHKDSVLAMAKSLVDDFHNISSSLDETDRNIEVAVQQEIVSLNNMLGQVSDLNGQIMAAEIGGATANDLRDQRDYLLTQISEIAEVTTHERDDGSLDVILNGRTMVTRDTVQQFTTQYDQTSQGYRMTVVTQENLRSVILPDGRLKGLLDSRDTHVTDIREQLDAVAKQLVDSVNALHVQGHTASSSGLPFFSGDSMHTIAINPFIENDSRLIATSRSGEAGDNDLALEIAALANHGIGGEGSESVGDRYRAMLIDLASQRSSYEFLVDNQQSAVNTVQAKIASTSGVSLDEEGANMLRYQNTYGAAAKVIATVQQLYDSLLNMV